MPYNYKSPKKVKKSATRKSTNKKKNIRKGRNVKVYTGYKGSYVKGLSGKKLQQRKKELARNQKLAKQGSKKVYDKNYWKSDKNAKTKRSSYTQQFHKKYGNDVKSLPQIAKATGFSLSCLKKVYNKGLAAWRTGHRPGASQQGWAYSRVHSFVTGGKTSKTADKKLYEQCRPKRGVKSPRKK